MTQQSNPSGCRTISNIVAGAILVILAIVVIGAVLSDDDKRPSTSSSASSAKATHAVTYEVIGTAPAVSMTYNNAQGGTEQADNFRTPWRKTLSGVKAGTYLYLSAQNQRDHGDVTCRILVDGIEVRKSTSTGAYVIATCSGRL